MANTPTALNIRTYNVGFGDCFLLSFKYSTGEKHVLIDFGTKALPENSPGRMLKIAKDIKARTGGKLTAVVATHRHQDHISGFTTNSGKTASGDIIASLKPQLVMQPWTEELNLKQTATGPAANIAGRTHLAGLDAMHAVAGETAKMARMLPDDNPLKTTLGFVGEDNIKNVPAVKNLATMSPAREYLYSGAKTGLGKLLPGVAVDVLGPPTLKQSAKISNYAGASPDYWSKQARAMNAVAPAGARPGRPLFPGYVLSRGPDFPVDARWFVFHSLAARTDQTFRIVTMLDGVMNNTSIILLFRVGKKSLLFPGDAQLENWSYALQNAAYSKLLQDVDLYKVGHHGSLNATPKRLWNGFKKRGPATKPGRMTSLMSTLYGPFHNDAAGTEVPRKPLKAALDHDTALFTTESLKGDKISHDTTITF